MKKKRIWIDRCLTLVSVSISWQRIAERRENSPHIAFKGYEDQLAAASSAAANFAGTAPVAVSVIAASVIAGCSGCC